MFIERIGSGERHYVGIHGWSGDHRTFLPLVKEMPPDITFWCLDLPGCGRSASPASPAEWSLEAIVKEIASAIPRPMTVIGNCSGAILSLLLAQRAPEKVARLVLIDAFASWPWYFRVFTSPAIGRYAYWSTFANPAGRWITNLSLKNKRKGDTHLTRGFATADHEVTYRYLTLLRNAGEAERFKDLDMPIDIVYGERTFQAVRDSAAIWKRMWPQANTRPLPGSGHLPILEATARLQQILFEENLCPVAI